MPTINQEVIKKMSVLVADDEPGVRQLIVMTLEDMGFTKIVQAGNGREAFEALAKSIDDIHLVVCDWNMPEANGIQLLKWVRGKNKDIPFLIVTGKTEVDAVVEAKARGVSGYILKPFTPDQFEVKLLEALMRPVSPVSAPVDT